MMVITVMSVATPMVRPSMVSEARSLCARRALKLCAKLSRAASMGAENASVGTLANPGERNRRAWEGPWGWLKAGKGQRPPRVDSRPCAPGAQGSLRGSDRGCGGLWSKSPGGCPFPAGYSERAKGCVGALRRWYHGATGADGIQGNEHPADARAGKNRRGRIEVRALPHGRAGDCGGFAGSARKRAVVTWERGW